VTAELRITLVVTTYNWPAALDLTLRSVARQSVVIRRSCPSITSSNKLPLPNQLPR